MIKDEVIETLEKLFGDTTSIQLGESLQAIIGSMVILKDNYEGFQILKKENPELYFGLLNSITDTLVYNLLFLAGYDEEEIEEISYKLHAGGIYNFKDNKKHEA